MAGHEFSWRGWTYRPADWRLSDPASVPVALPKRTIDLLALLLDRAPGVVAKDEILSLVWKDSVVEEGNIAFHVLALRKALDTAGEPSCIETVRGRGYRFAAPVTRHVIDDEPSAIEAAASDTAARLAAIRGRRIRHAWQAALAVVVLLAAIGGTVWWRAAGMDLPVRRVTVLPAIVDPSVGVFDGAALAVRAAARIAAQTSLHADVDPAPDANGDAVDVGRRLKAESVLTWRFAPSPHGVQVIAELTRLRDQRRLWSWAFDVPGDSPEVVGGAATLQLAVGLGRHLKALRNSTPRTEDAQAMALVARGRALWSRRTPADIQLAMRAFEQAAARDPSYARAFAGLADCYNLSMSGLPADVRYPRAREYAEKAVALDPYDSTAHTSLAFLRYTFEWRWADAESEFVRALVLDPDNAQAHHWYGEFLGLMGRRDQAIDELYRALALDPDSLAVPIDLVPPLLAAGRVTEARTLIEAAAAKDATWPMVSYRLADILAAEGRERDAVERRWQWMLLSGKPLEFVDGLRAAYVASGMDGMLRAEIADSLDREARTPGAWMGATVLSRNYARLGDRVNALHWLDIALDRREDAAYTILTYPDYDSLRGDAEFTKRLARVGLAPLAERPR